MHLLKDYLSYLAVTSLIVLGYINISPLWVDIGYAKPGIFRLEIPLLLTGLTLLYFSQLTKWSYKYLLPAFPVVITYLGFDTFYNNLGRAPRPSDLNTLWEVFLFSPFLGIGILFTLLTLFFSILLLIHQASKHYSKKAFTKTLACKALAVVILTFLLSTDFYQNFFMAWFNYIPESQRATIRHNGRLSSFFYYFWREKENRKKLLSYASSTVDVGNSLYPGKPVRKANIHLIVLESFLDPRMIEGIRFNRSPLAEELRTLLADGQFSLVHSPVYGGNTAQPEFELLSGIKAYAKVESVEFNVMNGSEVHGFVNRLKENGYKTLGTIATGFGYFNSKQAYKSLGLSDVVYLGKTAVKRSGDRRIFDGDLLNFNLNRVKGLIENDAEPIFNYVLGMYGHMPYDRNKAVRPDIINPNLDDEKIHRIANQFYYRTKALGSYLAKLRAIDPASIIYVTSDHLPPVFNRHIRYSQDNYTNIALLFDAGSLVDVSGKHYYEIPWLLWDKLVKGTDQRLVKIETTSTSLSDHPNSAARQLATLAPANKWHGENIPSPGKAPLTEQQPTMEELYFKTLYESL